MTGRKRHVVVDTLGFILTVVVHPANLQDQVGLWLVLEQLATLPLPRLTLLWADGMYRWQVPTVAARYDWSLTIVERDPNVKGFHLLPKRWVVERTFGWLGRWRRLSKDYEGLPQTTATWIYAAMSILMVKRLAIIRGLSR